MGRQLFLSKEGTMNPWQRGRLLEGAKEEWVKILTLGLKGKKTVTKRSRIT